MALTVLSFDGIHLLNWIISPVIPGLIVVLAIINRIVLFKVQRERLKTIREITDKINLLAGRDIANLADMHDIWQKSAPQPALKRFEQIKNDCRDLYQGRWIGDLKDSIPFTSWLSPAAVSALEYKSIAQWLSIGLFATLIAPILHQQSPVSDPSARLFLALLPLGMALVVSLPLFAITRQVKLRLNDALDQLYKVMARKVPVFNDQTGIASLVDAFLSYDKNMEARLDEFTKVTARLADSEMADGVRRSVEQLLMESVAPSFEQATALLSDLAVELSRRQEEGMQKLAAEFAAALSGKLASHLAPLSRDISQMGSFMADVKQYVDVALRSMDTTRSHTKAIQDTLEQSIGQMQQAQAQINDSFLKFLDSGDNLHTSANQMSELYEQAGTTIEQSLARLSASFAGGTDQMTALAAEAGSAVSQAQELVRDQKQIVDGHFALLNQHSALLSEQLQDSVSKLLGQIHEETKMSAKQSQDLNLQLGTLNQILEKTIEQFGQASATYVHDTLNQFDASLADIVSRLTQTAQEIQDAVDQLPASIQRGTNFSA